MSSGSYIPHPELAAVECTFFNRDSEEPIHCRYHYAVSYRAILVLRQKAVFTMGTYNRKEQLSVAMDNHWLVLLFAVCPSQLFQ